MKYCPKCGHQWDDEALVCGDCGTPLENEAAVEVRGIVNPQEHGRNIALAIIFSILTCGIYALYWLVKMNDSVNILAGNKNYTSGGMVLLFSIITCGIYTWYWLYKMGESCDKIKKMPGDNSAVVYLLLGIFGLGIVSYCLIQDTINKEVGFGN